MWSRTSVVLAVVWTGFCVCPALGQSSERPAETSPLRTAVARASTRMATEMVAVRPAVFEGALAAPQTTEDLRNWERLRGVKAGTRLVVSRLVSPDLKVRMEAVGADTLQVRAAQGEVMSLRRNEVLAVYQDHRYTTKQWVGIGALTGVAAGFVLGAIAAGQNSSELSGIGIVIGPVAGAIYGPLGGLFVAGIANRNPPRLIYRAPLPTESTASSVGTEPTAR